MQAYFRPLVCSAILSTICLSGCGSLLRKPNSWSQQVNRGERSFEPAAKSQPAKISDWTSELDQVVRQSPQTKKRTGEGLTVDSIQLTSNDRIDSNSTTNSKINQRIVEDRQLPAFLDQELTKNQDASRAVASVNRLISPLNNGHTTNLAANSAANAAPSPAANSLPLESTDIRPHDVSRSPQPASSPPITPRDLQNPEVISIKAVPHSPPDAVRQKSKSMDLLDGFGQNNKHEQRNGQFVATQVGTETIYFQPFPADSTEFQSAFPTASSIWDADEETKVIRNEHLSPALTGSQKLIDSSLDGEARETDWQILLTHTIDALEAQELSSPTGVRERTRSAIQARLLRLSAGDMEGALAPIKGLSRKEQAFWHHQLVALNTFLHSSYQRIGNATLNPATAEEALNSMRLAQRELADLAPLVIENLRLCREVSGFGQYETTGTDFKPGQQAIVYCELRNFSSNLESDANNLQAAPQFTARLQGGFQIIGGDNQIVAQHQYKTIEDRSRNVRTDFYMYFPVTIPDIEDGEYWLNVSIADMNANKRADLSEPLKITIRSATPSKTAKSKSPASESTRR